MTKPNRTKLNRLLANWPQGTVADSSWLIKQGFSKELLGYYKRTGWIKLLRNGANIRANDKVDWHGGLYAAQSQLNLPVHAGGKTALQLQGYAHFLPLGKKTLVTLFGPPKAKLPTWFLKNRWGVNINLNRTNLFPVKDDIGLTQKDMGSYSIKISSPERAIMEVLHLVPHAESYEEANLLMEGLTTLRPTMTQKLLENCNSIKVKRLFLYMAEQHNHPWLKKLNIKNINLGKGKRVIQKGGHFNSKYNISVPGTRPTDEFTREKS